MRSPRPPVRAPAAWGIDPKDTWRALGAVMDMSDEIELNLADVAAVRAEILEVIEREGVAQ